jgi:hypothetical protein
VQLQSVATVLSQTSHCVRSRAVPLFLESAYHEDYVVKDAGLRCGRFRIAA